LRISFHEELERLEADLQEEGALVLDEREYGLRMLVVSRCVEHIGEQIAYLVTGDFRELTDASHRV
jgi:hypothetical protein